MVIMWQRMRPLRAKVEAAFERERSILENKCPKNIGI